MDQLQEIAQHFPQYLDLHRLRQALEVELKPSDLKKLEKNVLHYIVCICSCLARGVFNILQIQARIIATGYIGLSDDATDIIKK